MRSHCPNIGVFVTAARALETALHSPSTGVLVNEFVGAKVDLKGDPKFEGRNHLVSEDGEPVDPFDLYIYTDSGLRLGALPLQLLTECHRNNYGARTISERMVL